MVIRIGIDMDGVLSNFEDSHAKRMRELSLDAPLYVPSERRDYNIFKGFEGFEEFVTQSLDTIPYIDMEPLEGAVESVRMMMEDPEVEVFIISMPTITNVSCASDKYQWLIKHFGMDVAKRLILTLDKTIVDVDFLIDDKPEITGLKRNPHWEHIIFDQPYNLHKEDLYRTNWQDFSWMLEKMKVWYERSVYLTGGMRNA